MISNKIYFILFCKPSVSLMKLINILRDSKPNGTVELSVCLFIRGCADVTCI